MAIVRPRGDRISESSALAGCTIPTAAVFSLLLEVCDRAGRYPRRWTDLAEAMYHDRGAAAHVSRYVKQLERAGLVRDGEVVNFGHWARVIDRERMSPRTRARIIARDGGRCRRCPAVSDLQIDHIVPVVLGGTGDDGNLQTLCGPCNRAKGATMEA